MPLSHLLGITAPPESLAACQRAMAVLDAAEVEQWEAGEAAAKAGGEYADAVTAELLRFLAKRGA